MRLMDFMSVMLIVRTGGAQAATAGAIAREYSLAARKDKIIRDTYRTLLSRGMKGCYVFCLDKALSEYLKRKLDENRKIYYDFASKLGTGMSTAENGNFEA